MYVLTLFSLYEKENKLSFNKKQLRIKKENISLYLVNLSEQVNEFECVYVNKLIIHKYKSGKIL